MYAHLLSYLAVALRRIIFGFVAVASPQHSQVQLVFA
jgi:hypothetical protein